MILPHLKSSKLVNAAAKRNTGDVPMRSSVSLNAHTPSVRSHTPARGVLTITLRSNTIKRKVVALALMIKRSLIPGISSICSLMMRNNLPF